MRLILARHGETVENTNSIIQGHLPGRLSDLGREQNSRLARRLKDETISHVYSSDLARATETVAEIAKFHPKISIHTSEDYRERYLGEFQGRRNSEVGWDRSEKERSRIQPRDGEGLEQLYGRAKRILNEMVGRHNGDTVLFVGHSWINKALVCAITDKRPEEINYVKNGRNASLSVFDVEKGGKWRVRLLNDASHLEGV